MSKILNYLSTLLLFLVFSLVIFGGGYLRTENFKLEIGSVDPWAIGCIIISLIFYKLAKLQPLSYQLFKDVIRRTQTQKSFYTILLFLFISTFLTHIFKHLNFQTNLYDMAYVHQALFYPFEGKLLQCDVCKFGTYLSDHISFSLFIITPITALFKNDYIIFFLQKCFIFVPIFLLIKKGPLAGKKWLYSSILIIIFCNRSLRNSLFWDFREDHIGFCFLLLSLLSLYLRKYFCYFLFLIIALFSKEHIGLITSGISIPLLFDKEFISSKRDRIYLATSTFILSLSISIISFKFLFPLFTIQDQSINNVVSRFAEFGSTPSEVIFNVLKSPTHWVNLIQRFINVKSLKYVLLVILPYFLFLRKAYIWLIPVFMGVALNIISPLPNEKMMIFHYDLIWLAIAIFALTLGFSRINIQRFESKELMLGLILAIALSGRWPLYYIKDFSLENIRDSYFLSTLKRTGTIAASKKYIAHLTDFPSIRVLDYSNKELNMDRTNCAHPSSCYFQANKLILDKRSIIESKLISKLTSKNWRLISRSPSGNLLYYEKLIQ